MLLCGYSAVIGIADASRQFCFQPVVYLSGTIIIEDYPMVSSRIIIAAALASTVTFNPAFANTTLYITGRIVEDPCVITPDAGAISMPCPENDKMRTRQVSYAQAAKGATPFADRAMISMNYLNPQKTIAVLQVDYR